MTNEPFTQQSNFCNKCTRKWLRWWDSICACPPILISTYSQMFISMRDCEWIERCSICRSRKRNIEIQSGFEPGSSECQSDALTNWATRALALEQRIEGTVWFSELKLRHLSIDTVWFSGWISLRLKLTIFCCNQQKKTWTVFMDAILSAPMPELQWLSCSEKLNEIQKTQLQFLTGSQCSFSLLQV